MASVDPEASAVAAPVSPPEHHKIAILGAGFAGLGMAIKLKRAGIEDFVVCERDADVGGTWWANTYPGCQCDVPSHLYSFSFAPNPNWSRTYPEQPELRGYLKDCAERFGVREQIRFNCEITAATWDEERSLWHVHSSQGELTADVLIGAPGPLSEPQIPDLPGLGDFEGTVFHTARWNHEHDLNGRRVAIVGTGASAIQTAPRIQPQVEQLTIFQRTPPWVMPHSDRPITAPERRLYRRFPLLQRAARAGVYWSRELLVPGFVHRPGLLRVIERVARAHIAKQVPDPQLRAKVTPDYTIGCKRILPSNRWYPTLSESNVELVAAGVREIRPEGLIADDGSLHEVDTIIFATGFHVTDIAMADRIHGAGGTKLADVWSGSPQAYLGTTIAGFPNFFFLTGPNTGLGHNSLLFMIEAQLHYVIQALADMRAHGRGRIEVRPEVQEAYNAEIQHRLVGSVWNSGGCSSWYIDANGRNSTLWPDFTWRFWQRTRHFQPGDYELRPRSVTPVPQSSEAVLTV